MTLGDIWHWTVRNPAAPACKTVGSLSSLVRNTSTFLSKSPRVHGEGSAEPHLPAILQTSHQLNITKWCPLILWNKSIPSQTGPDAWPTGPWAMRKYVKTMFAMACYVGTVTGTQRLLKEPRRSAQSLSELCPSLLSEWLEFVHMAPKIGIYQISQILTLKFQKITIKTTHSIKIEPEGPVHYKMSDIQKLTVLLISCSLHSLSPPGFP